MSDIIIKHVRLSFPKLFQAVEFKVGDGKPRWSATFLVEPGSENDKVIRAAIAEEAKNTWADKAPAILKSLNGQKNQYCYLDGDSKPYDGYEGMWSLACHRTAVLKGGVANVPPMIVNRDKSPLRQEDGKPYAGCYVNAKVSIYCQKGENPGVRASFSVVQFDSDADAFSANTPSADDLEDLEEGATAEDLV